VLAEPLAAASTSRPRASKTNANGNGPVAVVTEAEAGRPSGPSANASTAPWSFVLTSSCALSSVMPT
jgi:hypothetical protein